MIREYKNTSSAIGELYVRSRFSCNKKSHLRYRHVRAMQRATSKKLRSVPNPQAIISVDIWTVLQTEESLCILRVSEVSKVCNKGEGFSANRFI